MMDLLNWVAFGHHASVLISDTNGMLENINSNNCNLDIISLTHLSIFATRLIDNIVILWYFMLMFTQPICTVYITHNITTLTF